MNNQPLVSIIIPCYNREKYISQAIDSCLSQTYKNIEIIIVDDGSTDKSVEVIQSYGQKVRLFIQENKGVSSARNNGIKLSNGEFLVFLDSDDWLSVDIIEQHIETFKKYNNIDIACADSASLSSHNGLNLKRSNWPDKPSTPLELFLLKPPPFPACEMYRADTVKRLGAYDEEMRAFADSILRIRIVLNHGKVVRTCGGHATYRPVENSITKNGRKLHYYAVKLIKKLKNEFQDPYTLQLLKDRLKRHRYRYWFSTFAYHWSLRPDKLAKFTWHFFKVSIIDHGYAFFIIKERPWNKTDSESF